MADKTQDKPQIIDLLKVSLIVGQGLTMDTSTTFRDADEGDTCGKHSGPVGWANG